MSNLKVARVSRREVIIGQDVLFTEEFRNVQLPRDDYRTRGCRSAESLKECMRPLLNQS